MLHSNKDKQVFQRHLTGLAKKFSIQLFAWVILDNHYHLLLHSATSQDIGSYIKRLHGRTAYEINKENNQRGSQIWHNYWDTLIRGEADYWVHFNYIHYNPVKHAFATQMGDWEFSSYRAHLEENGEEWMADVLRTYPVVDFQLAGDS